MNLFNQSSINLNDKGILITGGTGSFGRAFVADILKKYKPARLVIYSRDELKQFEMAQQFSPDKYDCIRYFIGDVRDESRLRQAMYNIDYVIHAAALKHVPVAEYNPIEVIKTNIIGAENVINAAIQMNVKKVIALSTDKAANPINLYGATKLCSDKLFVAANNLSGKQDTAFSVVRYGNVLGSRGSVIPFYKKLLNDNAESLPITDKRMTRFWITMEQCISFVLRSLIEMKGGEIYIPKIPSMKVTDLANAIAPELPIHITGIRPGEKLHEIMITVDDNLNTLEFSDCYIIHPTWVPKLKDVIYKINGEVGKEVSEGFQYRSDTNEQWFSNKQILEIIEST